MKTKTVKNTLICNDFICFATGYYVKMFSGVKCRTEKLTSLLHSGDYKSTTSHAGKYAGRKPSWHIETGLLNRVRSAGLGHYVQQFDPLTPKDFEETLSKGEKLMTQNVKFTGNHRKLLAAAGRASLACKFTHKLSPLSLEQAALELNSSSSSGFPDFKKKGIVRPDLLRQAHTINLENCDSNEIWNFPIIRGFRLQLRNTLGEITRKIRIMYPFPGIITLLELCFAIPMVNHFISKDTFYCIGKSGEDIGKLLKGTFLNAKTIYGTDISAFDQSMLNEVIILAFAIIKYHFRLTPLQSKIFDMIVFYFCTSIAVSKAKGSPSYAFVKTHGVPSGSAFTNLVDSICQAIIVEYIQPGLITHCLIQGDDNLIGASEAFDYTNYKSINKEIFNLTIDDKKSEKFSSWKKVRFLGFLFAYGNRIIDPFLCINQLLWHTDFIVELDPYEREFARAASILLNGKNGSYYLERIFPEEIALARQGYDIRFIYLYNVRPVPKLEALLLNQNVKYKYGSNESLLLHLEKGYLIR